MLEISFDGPVRILDVLIKTVPIFSNCSHWGGGNE